MAQLIEQLSVRECQVMVLLARGMTPSEVGHQLAITARTVNQHCDNVADKIATKSRIETIKTLVEAGLLG
jgi:DNA-binding CsgD family transcriptional regulator